jgi:hypothetical protein
METESHGKFRHQRGRLAAQGFEAGGAVMTGNAGLLAKGAPGLVSDQPAVLTGHHDAGAGNIGCEPALRVDIQS